MAGRHSSPWSTESPWELVDYAYSKGMLSDHLIHVAGVGPWKQHFYRLLREFWSRCYVNHSWINDTEEFLLGPHYTSYNSLPAGKPHRSSCFFTPSSPQPRGCFAKGTLESWPEPMFPSGPSYVLRNRGVQRRPGPMYTAELPEQCVLWRGPPGKGLRGLLVAVSSPWSAAE